MAEENGASCSIGDLSHLGKPILENLAGGDAHVTAEAQPLPVPAVAQTTLSGGMTQAKASIVKGDFDIDAIMAASGIGGPDDNSLPTIQPIGDCRIGQGGVRHQ